MAGTAIAQEKFKIVPERRPGHMDQGRFLNPVSFQ
jgi:hypothetical protein